MSEEIIKKSGAEPLADASRAAAESLSLGKLWVFAAEAASGLPSSPEVITRRDSTSTTELWKRGCAPWQRPHW